MSPLLEVLANRSFRNLWLGQIFSQIATNMLGFIMILALYQRTHSNVSVAILVATIGIPALLLGAVAGVFVDHWSKPSVLFITNILRALVIIILLFFYQYPLVIYGVSIVFSAITQFFVPAETPLIPHLVRKDLIFAANSIFTFSYYISVSLGFTVAGPILGIAGEFYSYVFIGFFLLLAAYFVKQIPGNVGVVDSKPKKMNSQAVKGELLEGLRFIQKTPAILTALLLFTTAQTIITTIGSLAPGFADQILIIKLANATLVVMGPAVCGVLFGSLLLGHFGKKKWTTAGIASSGIFACGIVLLLLSVFVRMKNFPGLLARMEVLVPDFLTINNLEIAIFLFFLLGIANAMVMIPTTSTLQERTTDSLRGRIFGVLTALNGGVSILPVLWAGQFADHYGFAKTILYIAVFITAIGVFGIIRVRYASRILPTL